MKKTLSIISVLAIYLSCSESPLAPTGIESVSNAPLSITEQTEQVPPSYHPQQNGCEIVQVNRASISTQTRCNGVRFYVEAEVTLGDGYYNIWLPELNSGAVRGPFKYNQWSKWITWPVGTQIYRIAAETRTDSGEIYQCDRHRGDFTIECPPPPPKCIPTKPECEEQIWDEELCEWTGECPCEPIGEPLCEEQVWDEKLCKWIGECPPECLWCVDSFESLECKVEGRWVYCRAIASHQGVFTVKSNGEVIGTEEFTGTKIYEGKGECRQKYDMILENADICEGVVEKCGEVTKSVTVECETKK